MKTQNFHTAPFVITIKEGEFIEERPFKLEILDLRTKELKLEKRAFKNKLSLYVFLTHKLIELLGDEKALVSLSNGLIGFSSSEKKAAAARENGKLGGRPKTKPLTKGR